VNAVRAIDALEERRGRCDAPEWGWRSRNVIDVVLLVARRLADHGLDDFATRFSITGA